MKRVLAILAAVVVAGCTTAPEPTPVITTQSPQQQFVEKMAVTVPQWSSQEALYIGNVVCTNLRQGGTVRDLINETVENGIDQKVVGWILAYSTTYLCPEQVEPVRQQLRDIAGMSV